MGECIYEHDYLAFGQFDALDILPSKHSLKNLWESYMKEEIDLRENPDQKSKYFSSQPLFLARNDHWSLNDDFSDDKDKDYYEKYPFIFIVLLHEREDQLSDKPRNSTDIIENLISLKFDNSSREERNWHSWMESVCTTIKEKQQELGNFEFECYYPLNFSQGAVCLYSDSYAQITKLLANLVRTTKEISYAYTISGLKNTWIKDEKELESDELVDVSFDIVLNHTDDFARLKNNLDKKICINNNCDVKEIVGNADLRLTYKDVSVNSLISAYNNILNPKETDYKHGVSTFISMWLCEVDPQTIKEQVFEDSPLLKHRYHKNTESIFDKPKYSQNNKKALYSLLEVAEMLIKSENIRYIDTSIGAPIKILLDNISNFESYIKEGEKTQPEIKQYIKDVNDFLHYSQELLSSTLRADRQFFEVPGFNMILDEIPIKLVIAYNYCLYELTLALRHNNKDAPPIRKYAFLSYPIMTETMTVLSPFLDHRNCSRLYCISLPWEGIFNIRRMLPELTHEIGHCISNDARNRERRYEHSIKLISKLLVHHIYYFNEKIEKDCIERFEERYCECILKHDNSLTATNNEDLLFGEQRYYSHSLRSSLPRAVEWLLLDENFHHSMWTQYAQSINLKLSNFNTRFLSNDEWEKLQAYENIARHNILFMLSDRYQFNYRTIVDFTIELGRECFADVFMIMVLGMSYEAYLLSFLDAGYVNILDDMYQFSRIKAVCNAMVSADIWKQKLNFDNAKTLNEKEKKYLRNINQKLNSNENSYLFKMINDTIGEYLRECIKELESFSFEDMNLLTKKLYHDSWGSKDDNGAINYIQELLWKVGGEI